MWSFIICHLLADYATSLPRTLKDFVEKQTEESGYSTPSEYVRQLLREDQRRRAEEKLETLLLEGLNSGAPIEVNREYWEKKRQGILERHSQRPRRS
jgi:antitoxin ParD1/3/4